MSRIETLKKQFPHLNVSLLDILVELDGTKSYKYTQLLCKLFSPRIEGDASRYKDEVESNNQMLTDLSIPLSENLSINYMKRRLVDNIRHSDVEIFQTFKKYMERGLVRETDITKYSNFNQLSAAISLAELKEFEKLSEMKVHKEYEDDKWLLLRPLSFESSSRYGAGTRWCTTFKREKEYFFKYCQNGILVYMINKHSGEKYAMFYDMSPDKPETSFWDVEDRRNDITDLEIDVYLYEEIKRIKKSKKRNLDFLDTIEIFKLATECSCLYRINMEEGSKKEEHILLEEPRIPYFGNNSMRIVNTEEPHREVYFDNTNTTAIPTMRG